MYRYKGSSSVKMIKAQKHIKSVDMARDLGAISILNGKQGYTD